jgi:hypothetical protein
VELGRARVRQTDTREVGLAALTGQVNEAGPPTEQTEVEKKEGEAVLGGEKGKKTESTRKKKERERGAGLAGGLGSMGFWDFQIFCICDFDPNSNLI